MLGPRGYLFHCHAALFRRVPLPRGIRRQQSVDLLHQLRQLLVPSARKGFVLLADERQRAVDLRKLLRFKKGVFWNKPAADGEVSLGGIVVILKIMSVMDAFAVEVLLPSHELDAPLGGVGRQHCVTKVREDAVVTIQSAGFEPRCGFQNRHVFRSHFDGVNHRLQSVLRPDIVYVFLPVQYAALAGDTAEAPFFNADGQVVIFDWFHREAVLPQLIGGFLKKAELCGFVLMIHFGVLLVSKKISRSILKCSGRVID